MLITKPNRVGYAMTFWDNDRGNSVGWRCSLAVSFLPSILFLIPLPFVHES
jgi:hypothetical protein